MTRLIALELFGFKSFADRTRFDFPAGVTAVVGPNGSGKSNVVDAIKWVLGEQSVRSLRGRDMTDVIFAGSGGRKPLNAAEVSLIFDNAAAALPVDAPEVRITRRVYRSGESEYLVNGEPTRLRDIREVFSGTGAATEAYSVIEQGRVDALLVASGRDRRAVFEEAAGITRFRVRRTEALRRLERTEQNRQRLADIVGEVASRLETVQHQAARARRWRQMTDRLRSLRLAVAAADIAQVDAAVGRVDAELAAARDQHAAAESTATTAAEAAARIGFAEAGLAPRLEAARLALAADKERAAAAEATLAALRARSRDTVADLSRAEEDHGRAVRDRRVAAEATTAAGAIALAIETEVDRLAEQLANCEQAAAGSHRDAADAKQAVIDRAAVVDELERERRRLQSDVDRTSARVDEAHRLADSWRVRVTAAQTQIARLLESAATWEGTIASLSRKLDDADGALAALDVTQRERSQAVNAAWHSLAGWRAKLEACRERRGLLAEMIERQEGFSDAARRLLAADAPSRPVPGLRGPLADMIDAEVAWAPLVDLVLGPLAQALVVESLADLVRWQEAWAAAPESQAVLAAGGRIGFVPADEVRTTGDFTADGRAGVIGRLDRLACPPRADVTAPAAAVTNLLGRVWVVARLTDALPLLTDAPADIVFATPSGECLSAAGVIELGQPAAAAGAVARRSELRALDQRHDELERTVADAEAVIESLEAELAAVRYEIGEAQSRRQQAAERIASSRAELERTHREHAGGRASLADLEGSLRDTEHQAVDLAAARDAAVAAAEACDARIAGARELLAAARADIDALDRSRGEVLDEIHRLRIAQATAAERLARARDAILDRTEDERTRQDDLFAAIRRAEDARARLASCDLELLAAGAAHAEALVAAERSAAALAALTGDQERLAAERRSVQADLDEARSSAARLAETIHAHELAAGEARHRRSFIIERIRDDYDVAVEDIAAAGAAVVEAADHATAIPADRADVDAEIESLRKKLASMTSVNMEALAEAETLAERLATLEAQLADVTNAKLTIEQLVARIDDESRRLLGETIETVRGHFRELFERLFGGGQADIVLEPGVDLLETSVEIVSRPPGKEPRSISLLSGGEKTMTCVALLLAIFRSRPSPFCVLDEVDAALDEANVDRFAGVLRDFLSSTQFIIVTHSKKTMAAADTLYGVTMEESGVSKRVSVRFEATAAATARPARKAA
jgi:chromosome segregation protein